MAQRVAKRDEGLFDVSKPNWSNQRTHPLEIMCLGLSRTGTTCEYLCGRILRYQKSKLTGIFKIAMLEALSILGFGTSYNTREALKRSHMDFLSEGFRRKYEGGPQFGLEQFESLWGDYRTILGEPTITFAAEVIELYPDAKVILTVRKNEDAWLRSISDTMWYNNLKLLSKLLPYVDPAFANMRKFVKLYWKYLFWDDVPKHGIRVYREHNAMVQRLAEGRVLVYNMEDEGWGPLCRFLDKPVPEVEFPHTNKTADHRFLFDKARISALKGFVKRMMVNGVLPALILCVFLVRRRWLFSLIAGRRGRS
jgi:hypothetical protein